MKLSRDYWIAFTEHEHTNTIHKIERAHKTNIEWHYVLSKFEDFQYKKTINELAIELWAMPCPVESLYSVFCHKYDYDFLEKNKIKNYNANSRIVSSVTCANLEASRISKMLKPFAVLHVGILIWCCCCFCFQQFAYICRFSKRFIRNSNDHLSYLVRSFSPTCERTLNNKQIYTFHSTKWRHFAPNHKSRLGCQNANFDSENKKQTNKWRT